MIFNYAVKKIIYFKLNLQSDASKETNWKNYHQTNNNKVNSETQTETIDSGLQQDILNGNLSDSNHSQVIFTCLTFIKNLIKNLKTFLG